MTDQQAGTADLVTELRDTAAFYGRNNRGPLTGLVKLLSRAADALDSQQKDIAERDAGIARLRDWQATVTAALLRPGGSFFEDVPKHIRELRERAEKAEAALEAKRVEHIRFSGQASTDHSQLGLTNRHLLHRNDYLVELIEEIANERNEARAALEAQDRALDFDFAAHLQRQREFSERTFGPGRRTSGVLDHIRKELREIEAAPLDGSEWADVVILALDGFWRAGYSPEQIISALVAKQAKNEARAWPDWRTADPNKAIEHDRALDAIRADLPARD